MKTFDKSWREREWEGEGGTKQDVNILGLVLIRNGINVDRCG